MASVSRVAAAKLLLAVTGVCAAGAAHADDSDYLFGDWGGERTRLADDGIVFNFAYGSEIAHNVSGGERRLTRNAGQLSLDSAIDLDKLWGWQGAGFRFTLTERDGNNLNVDAGLHELMQSQEVYGRGQTWRLTQLWYSQDLFDQHLQLKLGRLAVGEDFSQFECSFMSLAFCGDQSGNLVGFYWFNYPVSQWGAVAKINFNANYFLRAGVYQVNPSYLLKRYSLALDPPGTTGALFPVEFGWTPSFGDRLAGSYVVGGWYTNANQKDVYTDVNGEPAGLTGLGYGTRTGAYGGYLTFSQQLTHGSGANAKSGWRAFFNATQADRNTATVDRTIALGAIYRGMASSRPDDEIGVAIATNHNNGRVARYTRETNLCLDDDMPIQGSEYVTEVYYGWQATRWLVIRPDLQWIHHPGGVTTYKDVYVAGFKSAISF
jgi:porin